MFRRSSVVGLFVAVSIAALSASPSAANPAAAVRVTNGSASFDVVYATSASTLGGYVTSDNPPLTMIPRQSSDAYTIASPSAKALAGELIYRAAGEPTRECTFRFTLTYAGGRFVLTADARASWTGQVTCSATTSGPDKTKGDFGVTFTMK